MKWNMAAECISTVILCIIWNYSKKGNPVPSLKNRLFQICFLATLCAMVSNILSTAMLSSFWNVPYSFTYIITTIYFIATPLMGMAYFWYTAATVYERRSGIEKIVIWSSIPGISYLILVILNPFFKDLFDIKPDGSYVQGPLILSTYIVFYIYCMACMVLVVLKHSWVDPPIRRILASFPIIAAVVIIIQQIYPSILLSGSAATCALLLIYLYLQNKQISIDYLTNLPNRQEFLKMLELQIRKSSQIPFSIIVLSLRNFKQINDTYGQQSGDAFLQAISNYLLSIVMPQCLYRFSGDEFAILIKNNDAKAIRTIVHQIREHMETPWTVQEYSCVIEAAIGIVQYPESAEDVEGLINGIEYSVSQIKAKKIGPVCYCGQEMLEQIRRKAQIVEILKEKLRINGFEVYYQPIISTKSQKFVLAESLLRIPNSPLGPLYPSEFIPIAEETGMIIPITYQVLDQVCKFINHLTRQKIVLDGINVNFSTIQFHEKNLAEKVLQIIEKNKTPYSKVKIEITESVLAENAQTVREFAEQMHKYGVLFGLDDFGTGYSNIVTVMNTPLDTIKLDKSLLWSAMENKQSAIMLKSLTHIFHSLGLNVLAEGVETSEQNQFAADCEIDFIQGYLYAKPMPAKAAVQLLKSAQTPIQYVYV